MMIVNIFDSIRSDVICFFAIASIFLVSFAFSLRVRRGAADSLKTHAALGLFAVALLASGVFLALRVRWWMGLVPLIPLPLFISVIAIGKRCTISGKTDEEHE
jgi:hypothetical protein